MKFRFMTVLLLILTISFPSYANLTYVRTYYNKEVKMINQYDTGGYGYVSCLPTSIKMILDYQNIKCENVSAMFYKMNGNENGVYISDAMDYLNDLYDVSALIGYLYDRDGFKTYIDGNSSYIISINPRLIKNQKDKVIPILSIPVGKDYYTYQDSVHAIAVIGYVEVDDELYLEVLDPLSRKVLFYDVDNVVEALQWNGLMIVQKREIEDINKENAE